jgi:hypothetical protein
MSGSRVRENRMHGLTGGRWRGGSHGEPEACTRRETGGTEPRRLPLADQPAAYLTAVSARLEGRSTLLLMSLVLAMSQIKKSATTAPRRSGRPGTDERHEEGRK